MCKPLVGLVILFLAPALASGQTVNAPDRLWAAQPQLPPSGESDWGNLQQVRVGQKIEVVDTNLKKLKGTFLSFSEEAISLRVKKDEVGVQRPNVLRVSLRGRPKRSTSALVGAAIGALAGLTLGAVVPETECGRGCMMGMSTVIGAGVGAGVGAAVSFVPRYRTIYRAKGKRGGTVR